VFTKLFEKLPLELALSTSRTHKDSALDANISSLTARRGGDALHRSKRGIYPLKYGPTIQLSHMQR
jgi:hypothetical protein